MAKPDTLPSLQKCKVNTFMKILVNCNTMFSLEQSSLESFHQGELNAVVFLFLSRNIFLYENKNLQFVFLFYFCLSVQNLFKNKSLLKQNCAISWKCYGTMQA